VRERTRELAEKNEELEKMNAELKSFAYVSSHDLQEPLRKIRIFTERILDLEKDNLSAKGKDYFGRIEKAASTMQTLIRDLLIYSKASNPERNIEIISVNEALNEVLELFTEEIEEKNAKIIAGDLGNLHAIPFQFKQLLTNLLSNSLKFAVAGRAPRIEITAGTVDAEHIPAYSQQPNCRYYHLAVKDNGIGFENTFNDRIFEIFRRLNNKEAFNGTGIGLAIVKKIVDNHHGFIIADGKPGEGARFDIYFPILL
jgi:light-regulated signal transduction histidine kinase (bacteriophytochrome)